MKLTPEQRQARIDANVAWSANIAAARNMGPVTSQELANFTLALTEKFARYYQSQGFTNEANHREAVVELGSKSARIVSRSPFVDDQGRHYHASAYCFIDLSNGDILKPAGYKGPAKGVRGNIRVGGSENWWSNALTPYGTAYLR